MLLLLAMTGFSATYVKSLTLLVEPLLPHVPFGVLSATLTAVVLVLVLPGGLVSVVRSDVVSFVGTLVILPVLLVVGASTSAPLGGLAAVPAMVAAWLPSGLRGVGFAVLFAAALTTLAGVWTAMAAMVAADFGWRESRQIGHQRWIVAALAFALLAGFYWPRANAAGAWASVLVGVVWGIGTFLVVGESGGYTWPWAMYGIPLIFTTGVIVSLATPAPGLLSLPRPRRRS